MRLAADYRSRVHERFNDPSEDDGTKGMLLRYTDGFSFKASKPTAKFLTRDSYSA